MYNIDVGWLCTTGAAIGLGLSVRISRCGGRRVCVVGWTGGRRTLGQEWLDQVLVVADIGSRRAGSVRGRLCVLEMVVVDIVGMVNRIGARVTSELIVSTAA